MSQISQKNAYLFRITHIENVPWLLKHGIHCRNSTDCDPKFHSIGDLELISKRAARTVPVTPGGTLSDYVPFYFTPSSLMLYKIKTGHGVVAVPMPEIVILVSSIPKLIETATPFVFTDRHAYLVAARFSSDPRDLNQIDWGILAAHDFKRDPEHPDKVERYQAEALVHRHVRVSTLLGIACYSSAVETRLREMMASAGEVLKIAVRPDWYFE